MARSNVEAEIARLDALSRARALTEFESRQLEVMLRAQHAYDRLATNSRQAAEKIRAAAPTAYRGPYPIPSHRSCAELDL